MVTQKMGKEPSEEHEPMPGYSETYLGEVRDAFIDRLCGVPLLLHCRRAYSRAGERAGDERRPAGAGRRRHTVRARIVRLSGQEGAA